MLVLKQNGGVRDKLMFRWSKGETLTQAELADPSATSRYDLCVYSGGGADVVLGLSVPPSATKWSPLSDRGYTYSDPSGTSAGIYRMLLKGHPTRNTSKVTVKGKGLGLPNPTLGNLPLPVTAQLVNSDTGICVEAAFDSSSIDESSTTQFKAKNP
jgi:hypothetical protein